MKQLLLIAFSLMLSINVFAQYPEVTIMDIQGGNPIPYGDTLTINCGVVMVAPFRGANPDSGTTLIAGAPALILQDTSETDWGGILVRYPDMPAGNPFGILDTGMVIKCTGVVVQYFLTTEFDLISFEASDVLGFMQRPQPVYVTLDSLAEVGSRVGKESAKKWQSVFIEIDSVTITSGGIGQGSYEVFDENSTQVVVGNQSSYFRNAMVPTPGSFVKRMVGYIQNRDNVDGTGGFANLINPTYPGDVIVSPAPSISNVTRDPVLVGYGDNVTITAYIVDNDGIVTSAKLFYRKNMGNNVEVPMTDLGNNTWSAAIPAQNDSCIINYFLWAVDDSLLATIHPADTTHDRYFYLVTDHTELTIQDVQYSPFGGGYSGYNGYSITVSGVVTADYTDIEGNETGTPSSPQVYIQNGQESWSGIRIYGTEVDSLYRGDYVSATGPVFESYGVTQIGTNDAGVNVTLISSGNPLPEPEDLSTSVIDSIGDGGVQAEQWEGVLIRYSNLTVMNENADGDPGPDEGSGGNRNYGDILVSDGGGNTNTRVDLQDGTHNYHNFWFAGMDTIPNYVRQGDTFESVTGILWYSFSYYKLIPRKNDDFVGWVTDVNNETRLPISYSVTQNYPNPFNPSTKINYSLPAEGNVTLKIYNILGQEVRTLINNENKSAGDYTISFDASNLASGVYFYRIEVSNYVEVKKMMLLK
jgi:hypothetical protein